MKYLLGAVDTVPLLLDGLVTTLLICGLASILALVGAVCIVAARRSGIGVVVWTAKVYVTLMRGLPIVILVFLLYFGVPALFDLGRVSALWVGVLALAMNGAAFQSEVLRGAIARLPNGQTEGAYALGLNKFQLWRLVLTPQVLPIALPALAGEIGFLIKASPVLSLITVVDLTRRAQQVTMQTFDPLGPLLAACFLYFLLIGSISWVSRYLETRLTVGRTR
ncbi:amino acid ABC transporter permease [Shinella curvata]|uniref:Amino acid ABC transporter permease n=1 Tax=Shinella curvata TaxID=1817964 RepID=A0ABT8XB80_9HYPH|nr:amino acid ABC transporter permease [Shinella curvata]MCJ8054618.1 amino acid ABC transporter permease [Shinella curvata]MDO6120987.1 amino acid ABC transporter permease [Shinella curvata]